MENLAPIVGLLDEVTKEYVDDKIVVSNTAPTQPHAELWVNLSVAGDPA